MDFTIIQSLYINKNYSAILEHSSQILEGLDSGSITLLLKSVIHTEGEDDSRVRDLLFLMLVTLPNLKFRGGLTLTLDMPDTYHALVEFAEKTDGLIDRISATASISHIVDRLDAPTDIHSHIQTNREKFLMLMFFCLELYDLDHAEYPLIKWLLHHLYKHD